jgi:hypothetical protein
LIDFGTTGKQKLREVIIARMVDFWRNFHNLFLKIHHLSGSQKEIGSVTVPELLYEQFSVSTQKCSLATI